MANISDPYYFQQITQLPNATKSLINETELLKDHEKDQVRHSYTTELTRTLVYPRLQSADLKSILSNTTVEAQTIHARKQQWRTRRRNLKMQCRNMRRQTETLVESIIRSNENNEKQSRDLERWQMEENQLMGVAPKDSSDQKSEESQKSILTAEQCASIEFGQIYDNITQSQPFDIITEEACEHVLSKQSEIELDLQKELDRLTAEEMALENGDIRQLYSECEEVRKKIRTHESLLASHWRQASSNDSSDAVDSEARTLENHLESLKRMYGIEQMLLSKTGLSLQLHCGNTIYSVDIDFKSVSDNNTAPIITSVTVSPQNGETDSNLGCFDDILSAAITSHKAKRWSLSPTEIGTNNSTDDFLQDGLSISLSELLFMIVTRIRKLSQRFSDLESVANKYTAAWDMAGNEIILNFNFRQSIAETDENEQKQTTIASDTTPQQSIDNNNADADGDCDMSVSKTESKPISADAFVDVSVHCLVNVSWDYPLMANLIDNNTNGLLRASLLEATINNANIDSVTFQRLSNEWNCVCNSVMREMNVSNQDNVVRFVDEIANKLGSTSGVI